MDSLCHVMSGIFIIFGVNVGCDPKPRELVRNFSIYSSLPWKPILFYPVKMQQKLTGSGVVLDCIDS